jgi:RecA-family ATPase
MSVANGSPWLGLATRRKSVLFLNGEIQPLFFLSRVKWLADEMGMQLPSNLYLANRVGIADVAQELDERPIDDLGLIIIDPLYKVLSPLDESDSKDVAQFAAVLDELVERTGAAILCTHHHRKGDLRDVSAIDRASGSGVLARDADSIISLSPHAEENCFSFDATLRNFGSMDPFVIRQDFPLFTVDHSLDPSELRKGNRSQRSKP